MTQADVKPDTTPTPQETGAPPRGSFLQGLKPGDIVRDKRGQRIRVQKVIPGGLRIHDPKSGVREKSWKELEDMDLQPDVQGGQAARRLGELRREAEVLGLDLGEGASIKDITEAIGQHMAQTLGNNLDQIDPMLASDGKNLQDFESETPWRSSQLFRDFWDNDNIVAEEKLDGVRLKLHITPDGIRADSRRRDSKNRLFSEKSANFGHLMAMRLPDLEGTVLDGEGMIPAESGILPSGVEFRGSLSVSTAATNAGPEVSRQIQNKFGPMQFWLFDILRYKGEDVSKKPFSERRKLLEKVREQIVRDLPPAADFLHTTRMAEGDDKIKLYEEIISKGGEGIIFKTNSHRYQEGKRSKEWTKLKKFQEVDAYVSGYVPGKAGNEGLVGALELSVRIDGREVPIAAVSQLTGEQRLTMSAPDGSLKPEYYKRVVTFRGQELTKGGRFRHAVFVGFRDDKNLEDIDGYEVREELIKLGVLPDPEKGKKVVQETFV